MNEFGVVLYNEQFEELMRVLRSMSGIGFDIGFPNPQERYELAALHALLVRGEPPEGAVKGAKLAAKLMMQDD